MRKTLVEEQTERLKSEYENFQKKLAGVCTQYIYKENSKDTMQKPNYKAGILFNGLTTGAKEDAKKLMAISCKLEEGNFEQSVRSLGQYYTNLKGVVTRLSKDLENSKGTQKFLIQIVDVLLGFGEFASQFSSDCLRDLATLGASQSSTHMNAEKLSEKNQELEQSLNQTNTTIVNLNQSISELRDQVNRSQIHSRVNEATNPTNRSSMNVSSAALFGVGSVRSAQPAKADLGNDEARKRAQAKIKAVLNPPRFKALQLLSQFSEESIAMNGEMQKFARENNVQLLESDFTRDLTFVRAVMKDILKDYKCEKAFSDIVKTITPRNELLFNLHVKLIQILQNKENTDQIDKPSKFVEGKIAESKESEALILLHQLFKSNIHGYFEPDQKLVDEMAAQAKKLKVSGLAAQQPTKTELKM
jgi:hypothetical protein